MLTDTGSDIREPHHLAYIPKGRRVLFHVVEEVRRNDVLDIEFLFSLVPDVEKSKNLKACILSAFFIGAGRAFIAPPLLEFRKSEKYGPFVYVGADADSVSASWKRIIPVPYHAAHAVLTLMPFSNPNVRLSKLSIGLGPAA